jgi:hypothetical protein
MDSFGSEFGPVARSCDNTVDLQVLLNAGNVISGKLIAFQEGPIVIYLVMRSEFLTAMNVKITVF